MNTYVKQSLNFIWEVIKVVVISLLIILPIRYFLIQPFYVKGASMEPNFHDYEYLVIDELSYRFHQPTRTDVVVMHDPLDPKQYFIKRVIGEPGETVSVHNGKVFINDEALDETAYLDPSVKTQTLTGDMTVTLGSHEYFVMGDNRPASYDSRRFGAVDASLLVGRVWVRAWPFSRFSVFN